MLYHTKGFFNRNTFDSKVRIVFNISLTNNRGDNISSFMLRIIVVISFRKDSFVFLRPNSTIRDIRKADIYICQGNTGAVIGICFCLLWMQICLPSASKKSKNQYKKINQENGANTFQLRKRRCLYYPKICYSCSHIFYISIYIYGR